VGKIYEDWVKGERVYSVMQELARSGFGRDATDGVRIPHPLGTIGALQMVVMEDAPGVPLSEALSSPQLRRHLRMAAQALAKLHRCPPVTSGRDEKTSADWISSLERGVAKAIPFQPDLTRAFTASLRKIREKARDLPTHEPVLVHGAFYLREILVRSHGVTIVDIDKVQKGDPALDAGNFLADLRWHGLLLGWTEERFRGHADTFLEAYGRGSGAELMQRIDFYYHAFLLRRAFRFSLRPKWWDWTAALLFEVVTARPF
jgi:aminoglycoside phosphotransferase (APT) family kinase protein